MHCYTPSVNACHSVGQSTVMKAAVAPAQAGAASALRKRNARMSGVCNARPRNHPSCLPITAGSGGIEHVCRVQVHSENIRGQSRQARAMRGARAFGVARCVKVPQQLHGLLAAQAAAPVARLRLMRLPAARPAGARPLPQGPYSFGHYKTLLQCMHKVCQATHVTATLTGVSRQAASGAPCCETGGKARAASHVSMAQRSRRARAPATRAAVAVLHRYHGAAAAEAVVGAAEAHGGEAEQGQRARAHDARLARHVQRTPGAAARLPDRCKPTALEAAALTPQAGPSNSCRRASAALCIC